MKDNRRLIMILRYLHEKTDQEHYGTTVSILEYLKDNGVEVDRKTLGKWIKDGCIPAHALITMSSLFNVSVDYLLGRE